MPKTYTHLSLEERALIQIWLEHNLSLRARAVDLFALALAEQAQCPLLTGDAALRSAAEAEHIEVKSTVWLVGEMVRQNCITVAVARAALNTMKVKGRRLPWDLAEGMLSLKLEG